jgi:hypothetical protein
MKWGASIPLKTAKNLFCLEILAALDWEVCRPKNPPPTSGCTPRELA